MRKNEYLSSQTVKGFISWIETILDAPQSFEHKYIKKKGKRPYTFKNLFSAYEKYDWSYKIDIEELSTILVKSIAESDEDSCANACYEILMWGGVSRGNKERVSRLTPNLCSYLRDVRDRLALDLPLCDYFFPGMQMTSGFSKIYSALIDDFMIYDSRVGAALGLLVRTYCIYRGLPAVPCELQFAWRKGLGGQNDVSGTNRRNPSRDGYDFPELLVNPKEYLENNIRANWLMSTVAKTTKSEFACIEESLRLRALEQALFMIGYDVSGS